jgi:uncharacterized protein YjiS (DUF1127 family)
MNRSFANEGTSRAVLVHENVWSRFVHGVEHGVSGLVESALTWQRRHKDRMHLMALDDRLLHDIGISLADVEHEVSKPFWKP